uniref:Lysine-specific demethylase 3B n=2 Tax=Cacopsylla melanoneura TaxID=428564 RepID=A0A8D9C1A0_9HEMI
MLTNENSNSSTGSTKTESSATNNSSGVHKLKKAWLQRHSGVETSTTPPPPVTPPPVTSTPPPSTNLILTGGLAPGSSPSRPSSNLSSNVSTPPPSNSSSVNGHGGEDSSSSDDTAEVMKRVPPKVKRKKKTKGGGSRSVTNSPVVDRKKQQHHSSTDSDKECSEGGKKANGNNSPSKANSSGKGIEGGGGNSSGGGGGSSRKQVKKSSSKDSSATNSPAPPNDKDDDSDKPPTRDPFQKPPVSQLKKTGESWLQDGPCFEVAPKLAKCRECRWTPNQRSRNNSNIFCRFYAFRRLRYTKNGMLAIAGFSDPHKDAGPEDIKLWLPDAENPPAEIDVELGRFILLQLAGQFCDLLRQEDEALGMNMSEENTVAWKRVVQGVREMCDVCETTLFNFHWACSKCGFVVCIDCYRDRKTGCTKVWGDGGRDRDEASWLLCNNRQPHEQEKLMLTQIIAGNCLQTLGNKMNEYKIANNINLYFKPDKTEVKEEKPESTLDWLADVALCKQNNASGPSSSNNNTSNTTSTSNTTDTSTPAGGEVVKAEPTAGSAGGGGFSKLRKLLIRKPANLSADEKTETSDTTTTTTT